MAKKLSQWDQKDWKKKLILLASHTNAIGNSVVLLKEVEVPAKSKILTSVAKVVLGLNGIYEICKKSYTETEAGSTPEDFTAMITSPGGPPVPPANTAESTVWFQGAWGDMATLLNRVGQKCPKIATIMESLGPSSEALIEQLGETFGDASDVQIRYRSMATFNAVNFPKKFPEEP